MNTDMIKDTMLHYVTDDSITIDKGMIIGLITYVKAKLAKDPMNDYLLGRFDALLDLYNKATGEDYNGDDETYSWSDEAAQDFMDNLDNESDEEGDSEEDAEDDE